MGSLLFERIKAVLKAKTNFGHLIWITLLMSALVYGLFLLTFILGWLCCMEPAASPVLFSNVTLFAMLNIDVFVLMLMLYGLYRSSKAKHRLDRCKTYVLMGFVVFAVYLVLVGTIYL